MPSWSCSRSASRTSLPVSLAGLVALSLAAASTATGQTVDFNRDVRPILSDACYKCHGPDAQERQAGLRLDDRESAFRRLESGRTAVVAGDDSASELMRRILSEDHAERMPPIESGKQLTPTQVETLRRWIQQGATWQGHWSFERPMRGTPPSVAREELVRSPIDRFVLARLDAAGLAPSPAADKVSLIRRVTLDLTGLPPTPAEIDAFLADESELAYERLVDRLLESERYGEHMARYWLDLVRYGDTHGLHFDNERALWRYRQWVIESFNANQRFDQFAIEQLAGDLLPEPTIEQRIATGFNRCNVTTSEGGSINEEVLVRYAVDRTETMSTVFLGMTLGCAVCHDHKFDPVTQREFYQLFAFYNAAADAAMDGNQLAPPPILKAPTPAETERLAQLDRELEAARGAVREAVAAIEYTDPGPRPDQLAGEPREHIWIEDAAPAGAQLQGDSAWEFVAAPEHPVHAGERSTRRQAGGLSQHFFTGASVGLRIGEGDKLFAYCWLDPQSPPETVMLQFNDGSWEHRAYWGEDRIPFGAGGKENHLAMGPLPESGKWVRLEVDAAAVGLKPGAVLNGWAFTQHAGLVYWDHAGIVTRTPQEGESFESQRAWELYEGTLQQSSTPQPVRDALKVEPDKRSDEQRRLVREHFLQVVYPPSRQQLQPLTARVDELTKQRAEVDNNIAVTMVMADLPQPRESFVLSRGEYDRPGEKVEPDVPAIFPRLPDGAPRNRLGLARWLVDPAHPLTARVAVNRFWQQLFGTGLVRTAEDFGAQGQWPTHPELLDWLAVEFIENGWDVKALMRLLVTSSTYRQSSHVTPELLRQDPENVLLARGPRFRLDAETVRDGALAASGLLVERIGGRSVRPYQPAGIWEAVAFVGSNTQNFKRDDGEGLYRRSLYTFWKRTAPPPSLMAFDAPSRETCVARRARTNTPLQALVLMNDEQYVEASRRLAARMLREGGESAAAQLELGFRLCTGRRPDDDERRVLGEVHARQLEHFRGAEEAARKLLTVGTAPRDEQLPAVEHAAMTMMANLLLNLDETITKE